MAYKAKPEYIGTAEAAKELGVIQRRVRALIDEGKIPALMVGKSYVIDRRDFIRFKRTWTRKPGWPLGMPRKPRRLSDTAIVALEDQKAATKERVRRKGLRGRPLKRGPLLTFLALRKEGPPASRRTRSLAALAVMREAAPRVATRERLEKIAARFN